MEQIFYLSDQAWTYRPKHRVLVFHGKEKYCKKLTVQKYEALGNFVLTCVKYKGKLLKRFVENCNGTLVLFVDHKEKYNVS
jgi:hypothetical protein